MDLTGLLPHLIASLNAASTGLLVWALLAIRRGDRDRHRQVMLGNLVVCVVFLAAYLTQVALVGHKRFPGDDWVRTLFLGILTSHTLLAVSLLPLVPRTLYLAVRGRFSEHRRIARFTYPIWLYVAVTGVVVYWMNNHLRPAVGA